MNKNLKFLHVYNRWILLLSIVIVCLFILFNLLDAHIKVPHSANASSPINTVFLVVMENHNWSQIKGSSSAPYINNTLLPMASYATQYYDSGKHPSLPNYLWLEAGTNFGITSDCLPSSCSQSTTSHLEDQLINAGLTWKAYEEDISGTVCPLTDVNKYITHHNPNVYFDDDTGSNNTNDPYCIAHNVVYSQLATDLANNTVPNYAFIGPNGCDDMHNSSGCSSSDEIKNGDTWLSNNVPTVFNSQAYKNNGVIIITWNEGKKTKTGTSDGPLGLIVLSPVSKGGGYNNSIHYTHSSTLRTIEEIFNLSFLGDAKNATDLSDLFSVPLQTTPTPTPTPTSTPTPNPSITPTVTPTPNPSLTPTPTPTPSSATCASVGGTCVSFCSSCTIGNICSNAYICPINGQFCCYH